MFDSVPQRLFFRAWLSCAVACFALFPLPSHASSLSVEVLADSPDCGGQCFDFSQESAVGPLSLMHSESFTDNFAEFDWTASAMADYSGLHAVASQVIDLHQTAAVQGAVEANAILNDSLHTTGYSPVHGYVTKTGFLVIWTVFSGRVGPLGGLDGALEVNDAFRSITCTPKSESGIQICRIVIPALDADPVNFQLVLGPFVSFELIGQANNLAGGESDFQDTAYVASIQTLNSEMQLTSGITITADSGFDYPVNAAVPTRPEPSSVYLLLVPSVAVLLGFQKRTKRKQARARY